MSSSGRGRCDIISRLKERNARTLVTGLDIGASKVSAVLAEIDRAGAFTVPVHVTVPSKGASKGGFSDLSESVDAVAKALGAVRAKSGRRPAAIYVNISGESVKGARSRGMIPLALRGREVTAADMARCVDVASTVHLPFDREIVHKIVQNFSVDDQPWIRSPLGLYASRLSAEVYIITAGVNHIQNIYKCVNNAGYDIKEIVFTGMADGAALLDPASRETGSLILDMGASLTEIAFFAGGDLAAMDIVPVGWQDVQAGFRGSEPFRMVVDRVRALAADPAFPSAAHAPVTITGGMAFEDGIAEALEEGLGRPVRMGMVKDVTGDVSGLDRLRLVTAIGLCRYAYEQYEKKAREDRDVVKRLTTRVVDLFNSYF